MFVLPGFELSCCCCVRCFRFELFRLWFGLCYHVFAFFSRFEELLIDGFVFEILRCWRLGPGAWAESLLISLVSPESCWLICCT